ncbi:MAG: glycosyltransferase family 2 protein [Candidatus Omnitrophica bacterium]|nr:glycosyltransferase family 2 protein [Candidatus Omnitrophota bacterium]
MENQTRTSCLESGENPLGTEKTLVSVIVLNWNGKHLLESSLSSLKNQTYSPLEVIVVDNGSTDDSVSYVEREFPTVRIIRSEKNLGFAGGNNLGLRVAQGKYIMMLNNDTEVAPNCIEELVEAAEASPSDVGSWATKVINYYSRDVIDVCGIVIYRDGLGRGRGRLEKAKDCFNDPEEIFFISDCGGLYRKTMIDEIGGYDEDFFNCNEELDLGFRAQWAGWKSLFIPTAIVYHMYSATMGEYSPKKAFLTERNRIWTAVKNFPLADLILSVYYSFKRYIFQAYGALFKRGSAGKFTEKFSTWQLIGILLKAQFAAVLGIPGMWTKRQVIMANRKISNRQFRRIFEQFGMTTRELALKD